MFSLRSAKGKYRFISEAHGPHVKIIRHVGRGRRVLDVGCATGYLAEELTEKGNEVYGIEVDSEAAMEAREYYKDVLVADVESLEELPYPEKFFDIVICADVLEHLRKPDRVLRMLKRYLKPEGLLIVSLPNIAYWRVRMNLLLGKFDYEEVGIMDRTHLRFFTIKTGKELIERCGFKIIKVEYCGWAMEYFPLKLFPTWFAYQFVIVSKPIQVR
ncbi:MAG: class I SAM-dependent methyltransferase [Conexivisphaerales archaeon]